MLSAGMRLGSYEILSSLGAGGMGEVYKARDTRLERTVALKVLPAALATDPERKQRFEREARAISSLNHPHICALYDIGNQDGIEFLVMEHLEGETLEERLKKGPLPIEQVFQYAIQITEALDQAHRHGVIHRDLKPANIMLTKLGAKLLDFGLAKVLEAAPAGGLTALPTVSQSLTAQGTILGTFQYMSPEQLEGQDADARSDIFALGAVLYEMASGRKAFAAKSQASLISAIMTAEPQPISAAQPMAPPTLEHVVRTCLAKDPEARWQTAHDVLVQLKWIAEGGSQAGVPRPVVAWRKNRERLSWIAAAVLLVVAAAVSAIHFSERPAEIRPMRFEIPQPEKVTFEWPDMPVISPDARRVVFTATEAGGKRALWLRQLDSLVARPLPDTDGAYFPFWSPDSRFVAFFSNGKLKKMDITGGPPVTLCDASFANGTWSRDGVIVFSSAAGTIGNSKGVPGLYRVSASGGQATLLRPFNKATQEIGIWAPHFLPDGKHFFYMSHSTDAAKNAVYVASLDSPEGRLLVNGDTSAAYAPPGYLLFTRQEILLAQPFDAAKLRFTGDAFPVAEKVGSLGAIPGSLYSVSQNGVLAYRSGTTTDTQLAWYNRDGKRLAAAGEPGRYRQMVLSPDGTRAVIERLDTSLGTWDLWLLELGSGILSRLTFSPADDSDVVWSPDGREIAFASNRNGQMDLFRKVIGGAQEELLLADKDRKVPEWWLKDGTILYTTGRGNTFYLLPVAGERKPKQVFHADLPNDEPHVSPDGHWIAYGSSESGRWEVYAASFPDFLNKRQVSNNGGGQALWRGDGKELYYLSLDGKMMSVEVKTGAALDTGVPKALFDTRMRVQPVYDQYGVTADGQKFLITEPIQEGPKPMTVVLNWLAAANRR